MTEQLTLRNQAPRFAVAAGTAGIVVAYFLPWLRTGGRVRASYELVGAVKRLGFVHGELLNGMAAIWMFVPLVVVVGWIAALLGHHRLAYGSAILVGTFALLFALGLRRAGSIELGVGLAIVGGGVATVGGIFGLVSYKGTS
jgi:hypothetical protein